MSNGGPGITPDVGLTKPDDPTPTTLKWSFSQCANAIIGAVVVDPSDRPSAPNSIPPPYGVEPWSRKGRIDPMTAHPIRGRNRLTERAFRGLEVCTYHMGVGWRVSPSTPGRIEAVMCTKPGPSGHSENFERTSLGWYGTSAQEGGSVQRPGSPHHPNLGHCPAGRLCGYLSHQLPPVIDVVLWSQRRICGVPT